MRLTALDDDEFGPLVHTLLVVLNYENADHEH